MPIFSAASRLIAPVLVGLWCLALLATGARAQTLVVENVSLGTPGFRIEIPRIEAEGSNLSGDEIRALFDGGRTDSLAARLAGWSAASVRVPELRTTQTPPSPGGPAMTQVVTYTNLVLSGLKAGSAQRYSLDGATSTASEASIGELTTRMGASRAQDFDLGAAATFFTRTAGPDEPLRTVYRDFVLDGVRVTGGRGVEVEVGRVSLASFKARPPAESLGSLWSLVTTLGEAKGATPGGPEIARLASAYADLLTSYELGPLDIDGIRIASLDEEQRPVRVRVGRARSQGSEGSRVGGLGVDGIEVALPDGFVRLRSFEWRGADLAPTLAGLRGVDASGPLDWFGREWRRLIPSIRGYAISGLEIDLPDEARPGERVRAGAGLIDVDMDAYRDGVPTQLGVAVRNLVFGLPPDSEDSNVRELRAAGYERVDLTLGGQARWDEAARTLRFSDVAIAGAGMGGARLSLTLGNAGPDLFSTDSMRQQAATLGLTALDARLVVEDRGLVDRLIGVQARTSGRRPEQLRREGASGLGLLAVSLLGPVAGGKVSAAVGRFALGPGSLEISAKAKDPAGVGALDLMMAGEDPAGFASKLDVQAAAGK